MVKFFSLHPVKTAVSRILLASFSMSHSMEGLSDHSKNPCQTIKNPVLSKEEEKDFLDKGYLILKNFFSLEEIEKVKKSCEFLKEVSNNLNVKSRHISEVGTYIYDESSSFIVDQITQEGVYHIDWKGTRFVLRPTEGKDPIIHRIVWAGGAAPELFNMSRQKKMLTLVHQLLNTSQASHIINQIHYKVPGDGVKFDWHQDIQNRRSFDSKWPHDVSTNPFVQTIIAVDPMNADNGAITIVPGLHNDLHLDKIQDPTEKEKHIPNLQDALTLDLQPGDMIVMHQLLVHGSKPNTSSSERKVFINGFSHKDANQKPYPGTNSGEIIDLLGDYEKS